MLAESVYKGVLDNGNLAGGAYDSIGRAMHSAMQQKLISRIICFLCQVIGLPQCFIHYSIKILIK